MRSLQQTLQENMKKLLLFKKNKKPSPTFRLTKEDKSFYLRSHRSICCPPFVQDQVVSSFDNFSGSIKQFERHKLRRIRTRFHWSLTGPLTFIENVPRQIKQEGGRRGGRRGKP